MIKGKGIIGLRPALIWVVNAPKKVASSELVGYTAFMCGPEIALGLVSRIYDAAADARLWPAFLEDFANAIGGGATAIIYYDMTALRATLSVSIRLDPDCERSYLEHYSTVDLLRKAWLDRFQQVGPGGVVTSEGVIEPHQFLRSEYYNEFLLPNRLAHSVFGPIALTKHWASNFTCLREVGKGPFETDAVELLRLLFPHLQQAIKFHRTMADLEGRHRGCLDALDLLPIGVILIDHHGRVSVVNRTGQQVLDQNDGLTTDKEGLRASKASQNKDLANTIAAARCTHQKSGFAAGGTLTISRPSGKRPFVIVVMPVSPSAFPPEARTPSVLVLVSDPEARLEAGHELAANIYGLTTAECRLAEHLMQGETLVEAAERLEITHNTARTHLQRIYAKTETAHQGELLRLLIAGGVRLSRKPRRSFVEIKPNDA